MVLLTAPVVGLKGTLHGNTPCVGEVEVVDSVEVCLAALSLYSGSILVQYHQMIRIFVIV